jgi:hypothetical protein
MMWLLEDNGCSEIFLITWVVVGTESLSYPSGFFFCFYSTGNTSNSGTAPTGTNTPSSIIPPPPSSVFTGLGPTGTTVVNGVASQFKGTNLWFMASSLTLLFSVPFLLWG